VFEGFCREQTRGPRAARQPEGLARRPAAWSRIFHSFLPGGGSTLMHGPASGLGVNMDDGEFEFVYHLTI